jgi:hypothetical protein
MAKPSFNRVGLRTTGLGHSLGILGLIASGEGREEFGWDSVRYCGHLIVLNGGDFIGIGFCPNA